MEGEDFLEWGQRKTFRCILSRESAHFLTFRKGLGTELAVELRGGSRGQKGRTGAGHRQTVRHQQLFRRLQTLRTTLTQKKDALTLHRSRSSAARPQSWKLRRKKFTKKRHYVNIRGDNFPTHFLSNNHHRRNFQSTRWRSCPVGRPVQRPCTHIAEHQLHVVIFPLDFFLSLTQKNLANSWIFL